jgi:asparagine synthase (glutamine-hydrolysing)
MCGIAGWLSCDGSPIEPRLLRAMTDVQAHRGPDGSGLLIDDGETLRAWTPERGSAPPIRPPREPGTGAPRLGFGHRRLAILDLSDAAHQPMADPGGRFWLVYNGEVYNYVELRRELAAEGWRFRSDGDTEVVLAAYALWGERCLERFNGMWAFAIWDARERTLFCARDRFGVKPFYYFWNGATFLFASEMKGLLAHPAVPRELNEPLVREFLFSGSIDHHPGATLFDAIAEIPPAHRLTVGAGRISLRRFWEIRPPDRKEPMGPALIDECRELLRDAVRVRLRSDVPVGGTLSGGIDSATITCMVDQGLVSRTYPVFSVQFPGHANDESRYVHDVVDAARNLELHMISPSAGELLEDLPRLIWYQDEPFADTSIFAHYRIMSVVRDHGVKVVLTGQGADEIFAGYTSYYRAYLGHLAARGRLLALRREIRDRGAVSGEPPRTLLAAAAYHATPTRLRSALHQRGAVRAAPLLDASPEGRFAPRFRPPPDGWSRFDWYLLEALNRWSLPHILRQDDRNTMAVGVESRAPFLDYRLVELAFRTADDAKVGGGEAKRLLREAGRGIVPASVTARRDKIGFYTPMGDWLRRGEGVVRELLTGEFANHNPFFEGRRLAAEAEAVFADPARDPAPFWWAFSLCMWHDVVARQEVPLAGPSLAPAVGD